MVGLANYILFLIIGGRQYGIIVLIGVGQGVGRTERLPVGFPVRAHVWVVGRVPGWGTYNRKATD